jgi:hypothetical protein
MERRRTDATCTPLCRVAVVVLQQPTEPFAAPYGALTRSALAGQRKEQPIALALMISLVMVMLAILFQYMPESTLSKQEGTHLRRDTFCCQ